MLDDEAHFLYGCLGLVNACTQFENKVILPQALEDRDLLDILEDNLTRERIKVFREFLEVKRFNVPTVWINCSMCLCQMIYAIIYT